ncbi:ankyrin repeat-containing domain protein [Gorgonomyces haynaldii]|nr:ankyrin repeat-containing domain protein [Gorgonomyces haynaldii]
MQIVANALQEADWMNQYACLTRAAEENNLETMKWLVENGADLYSDNNRHKPLHWAAIKGRTRICEYLLDVADERQDEPDWYRERAIASIELANEEEVKLFLDKGASPNGPPMFRDTPLVSAAGYGNIKVCKMLLDYGASFLIGHPNKSCAFAVAYRMELQTRTTRSLTSRLLLQQH